MTKHAVDDKLKTEGAEAVLSDIERQKAAWEEAGIPFPVLDVPRFPIEVFPKKIRELLDQAASKMNCAVDHIATAMLVAMGAAIGSSRELKLHDLWSVKPSLYAAVIGNPGSTKSDAIKFALGPVFRMQDEFNVRFAEAQSDYQNELELYEVAIREFKEKKIIQKPDPPKVPVAKQSFTSDSTIEALCEIMTTNPRGTLLYRDELEGWITSMNQYRAGKGADRQSWLSFFSGTRVLINRKGKPLVDLKNPFVGVIGGITPDVLPGLQDQEKRDDGFIHRILFCYPEPVQRRWNEEVVDPELIQFYENTIRNLYLLPTESDEAGKLIPTAIHFTPGAKSEFVDWYDAHNEEAEEGFDYLQGPWSKFLSYFGRFALILTEVRFVTGEIPEEAVDEHAVWCSKLLLNYFKAHFQLAFERLTATKEDVQIHQAIHYFKKKNAALSIRDFLRGGLMKSSSEVQALFKTLQDRGLGKLVLGPKNSAMFFPNFLNGKSH